MKQIIIVILLCILPGSDRLLAANAPQADFEKANTLFRQKQYTEAATIYQRLADEGYEQPELLINAGNAWYKANRTGPAIYNYEKALIADPFNKAAQHNLSIANQRVEGFVNELPQLFFQQWWTAIRYMHSPNGWAAGTIIFCWLAIAGGIVLLLRPALQPRVVKWATATCGVLFAFYLFMSITVYTGATAHDTGIIMGNAVKVKSAPDEGSKDVFELHEGVKVAIVDGTNDYCKIELPDGKTGWMTCGEIKQL
jgi:tetratricopeptide (TPR) repeat protein